ncbi:serine hydrolase domain-containing protein [Pseudoalteromonas ruthenica]|uniref:serine hydrolase domain-containing protein n=1 Tax=Pseudoalteromonas ruthenica TaxID=151081 RepID=UPI00241DEE83|nr:serine hydrolase domain-containing protein [Pseudoalteromonas ruthenica]|tara:strand:- start:9604 stop:11412 length:1809 start_codon:yes stop_codon:yes gene_type:complete
MIKTILSSLLILLSFNSAYANSNAQLATKVEKAIEQEQLVGITWTTVTDEHVQVGSAGYANVSSQEAMKPEQKMHVGSVTKSVLAMGVLHLVYQGALSLDTNVEALLGQLHFDNPWSQHSPIQVKHLLEHTAGLDNIRMWQLLNTHASPDSPLQHAFSSSQGNLLRVRTEPGSQYSYSNMGYTLLAMVIEAVTQQRYEEYLDTNLLAALGMHNSSFEFISQQGPFADPLLAMGYHENHVAQPAVANYLRPSGQFTTTAPDMAKFIRFLLHDGRVNGERLIAVHHMARLATPLHTHAQRAGLNIGHGLAFASRDRHQVLGMCHPGTTFGFRAYICLFPEQKKGFFYAINTDNETSDYERFNKLFINELDINKATPVAPKGNAIERSALPGVYTPSPNSMAEFEFMDMLFHFVWLEQANEHLVVKSLQKEDKQLLAIEGGLFRDTTRTQGSHVFYANKQGQWFIHDGRKTYRKVSGVALALYWLSMLAGLSGLIYIFIVGLIRLVKRNNQGLGAIKWGFINLGLFALPICLYMNQSFLKFGDINAASISLAVLSGLLPLSLVFCLWAARKEQQCKRLDVASLVLALHWCVVLVAWGLLPIMFWQ